MHLEHSHINFKRQDTSLPASLLLYSSATSDISSPHYPQLKEWKPHSQVLWQTFKHLNGDAPVSTCILEHYHVLLKIHHKRIEYSSLHARATSSILSITLNASRAPTYNFSRLRTYLADQSTLLYFSSPILPWPHGATLFCPLRARTTLTLARWQHWYELEPKMD